MSEVLLGYFIKMGVGGDDIDDIFDQYIWSDNGFNYYAEKYNIITKYGHDLNLLLIQYYVEGDEMPDNSPDQPRLSNYSNKNKDIAVAFAVTREKFHDVGERERREFIVNTTLQAIDMVEGRLGKRKLDIDFKSLRRDIQKAAKAYLEQPENLA